MFNFILNNLATIFISALLIIAIAFVLYRSHKRKKEGGGCAGCPSQSGCPMAAQQMQEKNSCCQHEDNYLKAQL